MKFVFEEKAENLKLSDLLKDFRYHILGVNVANQKVSIMFSDEGDFERRRQQNEMRNMQRRNQKQN